MPARPDRTVVVVGTGTDVGKTWVTAALAPDLVLLVADAGLGTLNLVRLTVAALGPWPTVTILNRFDEADALHRDNRAWLEERDGLDVVTTVGVLADRLS